MIAGWIVVVLSLFCAVVVPTAAQTHLSPDDTGFVSPDCRGPIGHCEFTVIHGLTRDLVGCILGCWRPTRDPDKIGTCEGTCQSRYVNQVAEAQPCPACLDAVSAGTSFTNFAHGLNESIYANQSPGTTNCEGALSNGLANLVDCVATAQLQSGICEIIPEAERPKRERCWGAYAATVDRIGTCDGRLNPTVVLGYKDYVMGYMNTHSHLAFCAQ